MSKAETRGERVIRFIEAFCLVPEGDSVGQPMRLAKFQKRFILAVYDNPVGTKMAILSVARKNGKTGLIAALALAHVVGPEAVQNSQIVSGAMSRDQAALVFNAMSKMIALSDRLRGLARIIPSGKKVIGLRKNVEYKALAADGTTAHGLSPLVAILDETGQERNSTNPFVEAITTAQGAYSNAMTFVISTQAPSDKALLSLWIDDALNSNDKSTVCHLYAAAEDCALSDRKEWAKANPALGLFRSKSDLERQALKADRMPSAEPGFRNLLLNQRVEMTSPFVGKTVWLANGKAPGEPQGLVYAGLDLSATTDLTALVLVWEADDVWNVRPYFWTPEKGLADRARRDKQPYEQWVKQGFLMTTPGAALDYDYIARFVCGLEVQWGAIAFDRWRMEHFRSSLARVGADDELVEVFTEFGQGYQSMAPALDELEKVLLEERMAHGGHPVLTMCAANAVVDMDPAGNRKLTKAKSNGRIDGMVALAMAQGVASARMDEDRVGVILL